MLKDDWVAKKGISDKIAADAAKPIAEANQFAAKQAATIRDSDMAALSKDFQAGFRDDSAAASNRFNAGRIAVTQTYLDTLRALRAPGSVAPPQPTAQPAAPAAAPSVPGLPPGKTLFGTFSDVQSMLNANPQPNDYFVGDGILYRVRLDGVLEVVQ